MNENGNQQGTNQLSMNNNLQGMNQMNNVQPSKNKKNGVIVGAIFGLVLVVALVAVVLLNKDDSKKTKEKTSSEEIKSELRLAGNDLNDFDLAFLRLENGDKNIIYSPLSIKYALEMLGEGASGTSKSQVDALIGDYKARKYVNSKNMSFANALFVKDAYKNNIKSDFSNKLTTKYNAEVVYDSFEKPDTVNNWVKNKTLNLVDNLVDDVSGANFMLVNALAIDMEWKNLIQANFNDDSSEMFDVSYEHEDYVKYIEPIMSEQYKALEFGDSKMEAKAVEFAATINNYDIVKDLGEDNIRATIKKEYTEFLNDPESPFCGDEIKNADEYATLFIKELNSNYKNVDSSTDFMFYDDEEIKAFAKDLKTYDGVTLQYIGFMPKKQNINDYINNVNARSLNNIINSLKDIKLENFASGKITEVVGTIPLFSFDYEIDLTEDLKKIGVTDVLDSEKADLSNLTSDESASIDKVGHKANIEFSNEGIKAAAATIDYGMGDGFCGFEYLYKVPVETIDITFNKPYIFLIRDKETNEVWFVGKVFEPTKNTNPKPEYD